MIETGGRLREERPSLEEEVMNVPSKYVNQVIPLIVDQRDGSTVYAEESIRASYSSGNLYRFRNDHRGRVLEQYVNQEEKKSNGVKPASKGSGKY